MQLGGWLVKLTREGRAVSNFFANSLVEFLRFSI